MRLAEEECGACICTCEIFAREPARDCDDGDEETERDDDDDDDTTASSDAMRKRNFLDALSGVCGCTPNVVNHLIPTIKYATCTSHPLNALPSRGRAFFFRYEEEKVERRRLRKATSTSVQPAINIAAMVLEISKMVE